MLTYTVRRLTLAVPTLLLTAFVILALLDLAPGEPACPLTMTAEVCAAWKDALGVGQPLYIQFPKWLAQFFWVEPRVMLDYLTAESRWFGWLPDTDVYTRCDGSNFGACDFRTLSWQTRSPVMEIVWQGSPKRFGWWARRMSWEC